MVLSLCCQRFRPDEWTFRRTVVHLGLLERSDPDARKEFRRDVADYHLDRGWWESNEDDNYEDSIGRFLSVRPDGIAFNTEDRKCVFLEFTRPMDTGTGSLDEPTDWARTGRRKKISPKIYVMKTTEAS